MLPNEVTSEQLSLSREATIAVGTMLKEARQKLHETNPKFSLRQFSVALGISPTHLARVESGVCAASIDLLQKMATLLGLDFDELMAKSRRMVPSIANTVFRPDVLAFLRTVDGASEEVMKQINTYAKFLVDSDKTQEK